MANVLKRAAVKSRNKLLAGVIAATDKLDRRISGVDTRLYQLDAKVDNLARIQSQINHYQAATYSLLTGSAVNKGIIQLSGTEIISKTFTGLKLYLDPRDLSVAPHLALDGIWEGDITQAWLSLVKDDSTVMDIGANFGYFGMLAAQQTNKKKSKVILFEANPKLIPYIDKSLAINWLKEQTVIENAAVADSPGKLKLNVLKDYVGASSVHSSEHIDKYMHGKMRVETDEIITVNAVNIDDYCHRNNISRVDLIKMDIEGFEDKAYEGMRKTVKNSPDISLFIEFTKDSYKNPKKFFNTMLEDFGYVYLIESDGRIVKPKKSDYDSIIGAADDWVMPIFSKISDLAKVK